MDTNNTATLSIIGKDSTIIPYRRELAILTGSTNAAILLSQMLYWSEKMDNQPFFKYKEPPQKKDDETQEEYLERVHPYKEGDSWTEELYFSRKEFDSALNRIAHNKNKKLTDEDKKQYPIKRCIHYWTTRDRKTYYEIKEPTILSKVIDSIFLKDTLDFRKSINSDLDIIQRLLTKITPEQSKDCSTASEERCSERDENFVDQENNLESQRSSAKQKPIKKKSLDSNQSNAATLRNNTPRKTKKLVKPDYICPKTIQPYIDVWSTITGRCYRGKNTNTYKQDCQAIKRMISGTFFNSKDTPTVDNKYDGEKLTLDEWRETLESFSLMRNNADYFPKNKKNIKTLTIKSFLYNEMSPCTMKSYFITCIESAPKLLSPQLKDPNPDYTDYVIQACKKVFDWDLGNGDRATAIKCANKLSKFFVDNKHRISMYDIHYKFTNQQVDELLTMLEKNESPGYPVKPTYLYGSLTYDKLLPEHLDRVGSLLQ